MPTHTYTELVVWQRAMDLVESVYRVTSAFPRDELFGLTSQARRSSVSIPANIAEGQGRNTPGDFLRFLGIAYGSLRELETHLEIARRLGYPSAQDAGPCRELCGEVGRLLNGLRRSLDGS